VYFIVSKWQGWLHNASRLNEADVNGGIRSLSRNLYQRSHVVDCVWSVTAHAQKPDFVFSETDESI